MRQSEHGQLAEPARPIPGPPTPVLSAIGLGLAIALLGHGLYSHEPAAAINLPSAGILLFVVVTAYRRRRPEAQPVLVSTQEAPPAEIGANLPP